MEVRRNHLALLYQDVEQICIVQGKLNFCIVLHILGSFVSLWTYMYILMMVCDVWWYRHIYFL